MKIDIPGIWMNPEWNLDQPRMDIEGMNSIQNKNWMRFLDIREK
jgi:hypothetical protein